MCCHILPSFHSHGRSLLAKPHISNLREHVKSDDMCVCECTVVHDNHSHWVKHVKLIYGISVVSSKHPEDSDCYENFLMDLVTFKNVQKHSKTIFGCSSKLSTSS